MKLHLPIASAFVAAAFLISTPGLADAKDKGKGKPHAQKIVKKALKPSPDWGRGASAFAPGRSGNLPPGHGGVPPGQLKKELRGNAMDFNVQRALARNGYYHGPIDGDIGRGSRAAILRYQADRGLPMTGIIDDLLLRALGIY